MEICSLINRLIQYALKNSLITEDDIMFVRNELMALLHLRDWQDVKEDCQMPEYPQEILDKICDYAVEQKIIEDGVTDRDIFDRLLRRPLMLKEHFGALETLMAGK